MSKWFYFVTRVPNQSTHLSILFFNSSAAHLERSRSGGCRLGHTNRWEKMRIENIVKYIHKIHSCTVVSVCPRITWFPRKPPTLRRRKKGVGMNVGGGGWILYVLFTWNEIFFYFFFLFFFVWSYYHQKRGEKKMKQKRGAEQKQSALYQGVYTHERRWLKGGKKGKRTGGRVGNNRSSLFSSLSPLHPPP